MEKAVQRCMELGEPYSLEVQALTTKGNRLWVFTNGHAHYENNKIVRTSGTIQDIDIRKSAEINLQQEQI
jgi:hypothetical protein